MPGTGPMGECLKDVDLVFVLDVSGSMLPFFLKLEEEIFVVDQALRALKLPSAPHYGLVIFVDDSKLDNNGEAHTDPESIRDAFVAGIATAGLGQVNNPREFNGTFVENSLDALYRTATEFKWRPVATTHRMIIHVTDDTFWEGPPAMPGVCDDLPVNRTECVTKGSVHSYDEVVNTLRAQQIWTSAFAAPTRGLSFGFIDTQQGFFTPYAGKPTIPQATGGNAWDIGAVLDGTASLSESINSQLIKTHCKMFPPPPPTIPPPPPPTTPPPPPGGPE